MFRALQPCSCPLRKVTGCFRCGKVAHTTSCAKQIRTNAAARTKDARSRLNEPKVQAAEQHMPTRAAAEPSIADYLPLILVSLLWGSYTPALRYLYSMDSLLTPQILTAYRTVISAVALLAASAASITYSKYRQHQERQQQAKAEHELQQQLELIKHQHLAAMWHNKLRLRLPDWLSTSSRHRRVVIHNNNSNSSSSSSSSSDSHHDDSTATAAAVLAAGIELGIWTFLGTSTQAIGLELSTATKAAFLTQTTAVFTPCLAVLCGQAVAPRHWMACTVAVLGSCCITLDSLINLSPDLEPPPAAAAITSTAAAAVPTVAALAAEQPSSSSNSSSRVQYVMVPAPELQQLDQQHVAQLAAASTTTGGNSDRTADKMDMLQTSSSSSGNTTVLLTMSGAEYTSSNSNSAGAAVGALLLARVSAVPCCAPCIQRQGIDPAVEASPLDQSTSAAAAAAAVQSSSRVLSEADGGLLPLYSSSSSDSSLQPQQQQQQQQELAAAAASTSLPLAGSSISSSSAGQQTALSAAAVAAADDTTAAADAGADGNSIDSSSSSYSGELYILVACCCYAVATVRLSMLAPGLNPVHLATSKTLALAAASLCWLLAFPDGNVTNQSTAAAAAAAVVSDVTELAGSGSLKAAIAAAVESAAEAWQLPETFRHGQGLTCLVYSALGPGALAAVMQVQGQSTISAAQAQVFYSLTPVWAALMAFFLLQGEEMGPLAWIGGGVIVAASIGAAISNGSSSSSGGGGGGASDQGGSKVVSSEQWKAN